MGAVGGEYRQLITVGAEGQPKPDDLFSTIVVESGKASPPSTRSAIVMDGATPRVSFLDGFFGPGSTLILASWAFTFVLAYIVLNVMRVLMNLGAGRLYEAKRRVSTEEQARKVKAQMLVSRASGELAFYEAHIRSLGAEPVWIKTSPKP